MKSWWYRIPRRIRATVMSILFIALITYMMVVGTQSVLTDPFVDTLWLSIIGAALLTFVAYRATKK